MKFTQTLAPIASLALAVQGASPVAESYSRPATNGYSKPVSVSGDGIQKLINAKESGDISGAISSVKDFFKRNPTIIKSILKVADQPKHKKARDEVISEVFQPVPKSNGKVDIPAIKVKAIDFLDEHPEVLTLFQQAGKQVIDDHPTLVENFQTEIVKLAKKNPAAFKKARKQMIEFSDKHNDTYEKAFKLLLKTALIDPKFSAKVAKGALKIDQIVCEGSGSEGCACGNEYGSEIDSPAAENESPQSEGSSKPNTEVESETPEVQDTYQPESTTYEPQVDAATPDVESPETSPEAEQYAKPDSATKDPQVDAATPDVETTDPSGDYVEYYKPDTKIPEVDSAIPDNKTPEVDATTPDVEAPAQYSRPGQYKPKVIFEPKTQ